MVRRVWIGVVVLALAGGGCATLPDQVQQAAKPGTGPLTCADVSYTATLRDPLAARLIAERTLDSQLKDTRGDMLTAGLRRLRTEPKPTRCEAAGLGETYCKAAASVCGR